MAGGIDISNSTAAALAGSAALALVSVTTGQASGLTGGLANAGISLPTFGPYRPFVQNKPATYSIVVPASGSGTGVTNQTPTEQADNTFTLPTASVTASTVYVFDATLVATHRRRLRKTKNPLQSGYNITYHAVLEEPQLALEIGMSDAMTAYTAGMWKGNPSKSISAYQTLEKLMDNRVLMTISTRQKTYTNMMLIEIESSETNKTFAGMRATLVFEQTFLVSVAEQTISARPNATDSTQQATVQPDQVPATITQQNKVTPDILPIGNSDSELNSFGVPAGGAYSSNNIGIPGLPDFNQ